MSTGITEGWMVSLIIPDLMKEAVIWHIDGKEMRRSIQHCLHGANSTEEWPQWPEVHPPWQIVLPQGWLVCGSNVKVLWEKIQSLCSCFYTVQKDCCDILDVNVLMFTVSFCWQRKDFVYEAISVLLTTVMTLWSWMTSHFLPWSRFHPHQACHGCPCRQWQNLLLACPCRCPLPTDSLRLQASTPCQVSVILISAC